MLSRFPFSMEQLPRHRHCGCFSLRFGCILTALVLILCSLLALAHCLAVMSSGLPQGDDKALQWTFFVTGISVLVISFVLSTLMLLGVLRDKIYLIRPWIVWQSIQLAIASLLFVASNAVALTTTAFGQQSLFYCIAELLILMVKFYMLTVVASYCRLLEERKEETERLKTADIDTWYTDL